MGVSKKNMMKVLIVDDDEALAGLLKEMINRMDTYRVKTAANSEEGDEVFFHFKPDIILTDDAGEKRPRNGKGHAES